MSDASEPDPHRDPARSERRADGSDIPEEFDEIYRRAYRRSLAEHPTEMMPSARPGKRAAEQQGLAVRVSTLAATVLARPRAGVTLAAVAAVVLIALAFVAGRLAS